MAIAKETISKIEDGIENKFRRERMMNMERLEPSKHMTRDELAALQSIALRHYWGARYNLMLNTPPEWCSKNKTFYVTPDNGGPYLEFDLAPDQHFPPDYGGYAAERLTVAKLLDVPDVHAKLTRYFDAMEAVTDRAMQVKTKLREYLTSQPSVVKAVRDLPVIYDYLPYDVKEKLDKPAGKDNELVMFLTEEITRVQTVITLNGN